LDPDGRQEVPVNGRGPQCRDRGGQRHVLKDNTAGTTIFVVPKGPLDTPVPLPPLGNGILSAAANNVLTATGAATATLSGTIWGTEE
jgi:hypothetical protein